jgi:CheY-like chemotaxis protein
VLLAPHAFATLALVAHEMVTNSAKYGALKDSHGKVDVTWKIDETGRLVINWVERGGPAVQAPTRRGFGSTVIERSIPYDLQGEAEISYAMAGVEARFVIPAALVEAVDMQHDPSAPNGVAATSAIESEAKPLPLKGRALLVEDNLIIALDAEEMLLRLGASSVEVASSVRDALAIIDREAPDFAVLDVNLTGETSFPIAERLQKAKVPYVFATGYGDNLAVPKEFKGATIVTKPYEDGDVAGAFKKTKV